MFFLICLFFCEVCWFNLYVVWIFWWFLVKRAGMSVPTIPLGYHQGNLFGGTTSKGNLV